MRRRGFGYVPFLLEAADWHFHATDMKKEPPEFEMLPSEYFRRQVYTTHWFERSGPERLLDVVGPDRPMFETDLPHRTSLSAPMSLAKASCEQNGAKRG